MSIHCSSHSKDWQRRKSRGQSQSCHRADSQALIPHACSPIWPTMMSLLCRPQDIRGGPSSWATCCQVTQGLGQMPPSDWSTSNRHNIPPELMIKNYELWLGWQGSASWTCNPLVGGANHHNKSWRCKGTSPEDLHIFQNPKQSSVRP